MPKPLPILPQMPWNVKKMIVDSADTETKQTIRPCSKEFRKLVSQCQIRYQELTFEIANSYNEAVVEFIPYRNCEMMINYTKHEKGYEVTHEGQQYLVINGNMIEGAVNQFVKVLRNPKVLIDKLTVKNSCLEYEIRNENPENRVLHRLHSFFSSLTHPVRVRDLTVFCNTQNDMLKILSYIQPGTLKDIMFYDPHHNPNIDIDFSELAETQHWKLAEQLNMNGFNMTLPVEKWSHFTTTEVYISDLTLDKIKAIFNSFLNASQWWSCDIASDDLDQQPFIDYFTQLGTYEFDEHGDQKFLIPIPNLRKHVEVYIGDFSICLEKIETVPLYNCLL